MAEDIIAGRNSVTEALRSERSINKILVQDGAKGGSIGEIIAAAKAKNILIDYVK
ncbi:MAG: 23S rRNA (guanosine(2251)-2'-O)-methyltransferase RlmB, partial [Phascolarctobacterium sp.]|nr:23S rRNA (guanosine(2251)-2'-O)-methyltransferase RlmB [Phascolarctobacterium sp.]